MVIHRQTNSEYICAEKQLSNHACKFEIIVLAGYIFDIPLNTYILNGKINEKVM